MFFFPFSFASVYRY